MKKQVWSAKQKSEYEKAVAKAKELYNSAQASWVDFTLHLWKIEETGVWRDPERNFNGFSDFLREEFPAAWGFERYNNAKKAISKYGDEFMKRVGIECAHAITIDAMFKNPKYVSTLIKECEDHFEENGVMPDCNTIRDYVYRITCVKRPVSRRSEQRKRERALYEEISNLKNNLKDIKTEKTEIEKLKEENQKLKEENQKLKAKLQAAKLRISELEQSRSKSTNKSKITLPKCYV